MRRIIKLEAAQTLIVDASTGETFLIQLTTSIRTLLIKNASPGQLYVFVLKQNAAGGHTVQWGSEVLNAAQPDITPNSTTVQSCIGTTGGILQANVPGSGY
jgi:hypothetical protein